MVAHSPVPTPLVPVDQDLDLAQQLAFINQKLDRLGDQVQHLYQRTVALEELKDELLPIARDAIGALADELETLEPELDSQAITTLVRKLLRNTPVLIRTLDRLGSVDGFLAEFEPLGKDVVRDLIDKLQALEERGYFRLLRGLIAMVDGIVERTCQEDIDRLTANVEGIAGTLKRLTQPSLGVRADAALAVLENAAQPPEAIGVWGLLRATRDPEVQQGLGMLIALTRALSNPPPETHQPAHKTEE